MPHALAPAVNPAVEHLEYADRIISACKSRPGALLTILERVQERHPNKYLPEETIEYIAARIDVPLARIYSVVTFYSLFNLEPQGRHSICVCRGTACHTRGSRNLLDRLKLELGVRAPEEDASMAVTTPDREYTLRTVACFGQCALAPVVEVDHTIYGHMNEQALLREIGAIGKGVRK